MEAYYEEAEIVDLELIQEEEQDEQVEQVEQEEQEEPATLRMPQ